MLNITRVADDLFSVFLQTKQTTRDDFHHDKKAKLLDNLKHSECKRGNLAKQGGGLLPICFVHLKAKSDKEAAMVTIYMLHDIKEEFMKYAVSNMELIVEHICLFASIFEKYNFHKEQEVVQMLLNNL